MPSEQSAESTAREVVLPLVEDRLDDSDPPVWMHVLTDDVAYETMKDDDVEDISETEAEAHIWELVDKGVLKTVTDDMWVDRKVERTLRRKVES